MQVKVTVYGIGITIKKELSLSEGACVLDALRAAVEESGMEFDPYVFRNLTFLRNGTRVYENYAVLENDSITVLSILGGG